MANLVYNSGRNAGLTAGLNFGSDTIKAVLVDAGYVVNASTHANLSDVPSGNRVATSGALTSKTEVAGTADAADITITAVTGNVVKGIVVYKDTGTATTSTLLCFMDTDTDGTTAISFTPNGSDVTLTWDAAGLFSI